MERIRNRTTNFRRLMDMLALPVIAVILIIIFLAIIAVILTMESKESLPEARRDLIECPGLDRKACVSKHCVFKQVKNGPFCYMKKDTFGYVVGGIEEEENGPSIKLTSNGPETPYGEAIKNVDFKLTYITENILRFQFKDADEERYEVPVQKDFPLLQNPPTVNKDNLSYEVKFTEEGEIFHFSVMRKNGTVLWDTTIVGMILSDQFLQIASYLPSENIYGLGEHVHDTLRHNMNYVTWPIFARDRAVVSPSDNMNLYGVQPFYTCLEKYGASHGVLFLNSNAMEVTLLPAPAISFRTIGGILDFFIFIGDNPEHVIQLYTSLIGRPMLPPYWSLGFQLSRYGYNNLSELQKVMERTREHRIPQAVQYLDIDHMKDQMDFTYDHVKFQNLPDYVKNTKEEYRLKWITILDPAIATTGDYEPFDSGKEKSAFVKKSKSWHPQMFPFEFKDFDATLGKVWPPDYAVFPDFFLNETKEWWKDNIKKHYEIINFDGLWIDMNEPANFETNVEKPSYCNEEFKRPKCQGLFCPSSNYEDPPYNPLLKVTGDRLSEKTLCMESIQQVDGKDHLHYDVHSLYGWSQSQPTLEAAQDATGTRSLVISRSTYPSSGRYAGHWLGDNFSGFEDMKNSIIGMLEFNMFGIPYIGADVCGFINDATEALCKRWMQLGAFYPFFRNHNTINAQPQDPAYFGKKMATSSRLVIERRIRLNPYLYTLFYRAHVVGSTVVRPLFHEFPTDEQTWDLGRQFMWGRSLLISPILDEQAHQSVFKYLPRGEWWHFNFEKSRREMFTSRFVIDTEADEYTALDVRGGTILPIGTYDWEKYPEGDNETAREIDLYIFPENDVADGELFMDDGISKDTIDNEAYALYTFQYKECKLQITSDEKSNFARLKAFLNKVLIFKAKSVTSISNNYEVIMDDEHNIATVTVEAEMSTLLFTWKDDEDKCNMLA